MDTEYESSRIERAKRGLYRGKDDKSAPSGTSPLTETDIEVANNWGDTKIITERDVRPSYVPKILKSLVFLAVLTTFCSGAYLLYQLYDPFAKPSDKNIQITFDVPVGITPGVPADITLHINNQNRVALEYANLTIIFPSGTRNADNPDKDMHDGKKVLGAIEAGQTVDYHTRAIFLGEENTDKELRASLEFRFGSINSSFTKEEVRPMHLLASPINLTVDALKEINSGQDITLRVTAVSNTVMPLRDVLIKVEYPLGFTYTDADPKPTFGNNIWRIGTMNPAGKFKINVHGIIVGEDTQEKVFHTSVGAGNDQTDRDISTVYSKTLSSMTLQRPFIGIELFMDEKSADQAVAQFGQRVKGRVKWSNNLSTKVINAQIEVRLSGVALDRSGVIAETGGFFRSSDNTIFWDQRGTPSLAELESGAEGGVTFSMLPQPSITNNQLITNPTIVAEVTVRGKRISEAGVPEEIKTVITQEVKVTSQTQVATRIVYFSGPFVNSGPLPPKVEQETSYTVIWDIVNTSNAIKNATVHAVIPPYVQWAGTISPGNENIIYDHTTNQITWSPGDIPAGTGINTPPKEVAFQIIFTPSLSQVQIGLAPALVTNIGFEGTDAFTGQSLTQTKKDLTTLLPTDPKAPPGSGEVIK